MTELDAWIAGHVTGKEIVLPVVGECYIQRGPCPGNRWLEKYSPTTNPAAALEVQKKCCEKLGNMERLEISFQDGQYAVRQCHSGQDFEFHETLEIAICQFAKQRFSK